MQGSCRLLLLPCQPRLATKWTQYETHLLPTVAWTRKAENLSLGKVTILSLRIICTEKTASTASRLLVVITCSRKAPERVQAAAEYLSIISKHSTQINLSSPKKAEIRNGPKDIQFYHPENSSVLNTILEITYLIV